MTAASKTSKTTPPERKQRHRRRRHPTKKVMLSPRNLTGEEVRGGKDNAFKKMNGACGRRRHVSTRRPKDFASTSIPSQSRGPKRPATAQESPPAGHRKRVADRMARERRRSAPGRAVVMERPRTISTRAARGKAPRSMLLKAPSHVPTKVRCGNRAAGTQAPARRGANQQSVRPPTVQRSTSGYEPWREEPQPPVDPK